MGAEMKKAAIILRKALLLSLFAGMLILSMSSYGFAAYTIDGILDDWGVSPFGLNPPFTWTPGDSRIDYVEEDWTKTPHYSGYIGKGSQPSGKEPYDIEAIYFDDDPEFIYLALVTSFPFKGRNTTKAGDIAIGFGASGEYGYGIRLTGLQEYGHRFVPVKRLLEGEDWTYCVNDDAGPVYLEEGVGEDIGSAEIYYWNATQGGGPYNEPGTSTHTWIMEAKLSRLLFGGLAQKGNTVRFHHAMYCGNDYLNLSGDFDSPLIPEPATLGLLGISLMGLGGVKIGRRGKR